MKVKVTGLVCLLVISMCSNCMAWWSWDGYYKDMEIIRGRVTHNQVKIDELLRQVDNSTPDSKIHEAIDLVDSMLSDSDLVKRNCKEITHNMGELTNCISNYKSIVGITAMEKIKIAEYAVKQKRPNEAKAIYRSVITTYTGDAYRSYVKQAEFGLEDLKGK